MRQIEHNGQNVPLWATEATQQQIAKSLAKITGDQAQLKKLNDQADKINKRSEKSDTKRDKFYDDQSSWQKIQQGILSSIRENTKNGGVGVAIIGSLTSDFKLVSKAALGLGTAFVTSAALVMRSSMNMGENITRLMQTGVAMDGVSGSTIRTMASLNRLGMSTEQVVSLMENQSSVVQALTKEGFTQINQEFARLTNQGAQFGLTMQEATEVLGEDLKIRQQLGILGQLDRNQQARMSRELYEQQLQATRILGRSIDDIRGASRATLEENASAQLRLQQIAADLGPEAANQFITGFDRLMGNLAGQGMSQGLIDIVGNEMLDTVPFMSAQGQELRTALMALGSDVGGGMVDLITEANYKAQQGDYTGALAAGEQFQQAMLDAAAGLSGDDMRNLQALLPTLGSAGEAVVKTLGEHKQAADRLAAYNAGTMSEQDRLAYELMEKTTLLTNSMASIRGSFSGMFSELSANIMAAPLSHFATALNESTEYIDAETGERKTTTSIMQTFRNMIGRVTESITNRISALTGSKGLDGFSNLLQTRINPMIDRTGDMLIGFIDRLFDWVDGGGIDRVVNGIVTTFRIVGQAASGLAKALGWIMDIVAPQTQTTDADGNVIASERNIDWGRVVMLVGGAMVAKAAILGLAAGIASKLAGGAASMVGGAAANVGGKAAGGGVAALGKGIGAGIKGVGTGLASAGKASKFIVLGGGAIGIAIGLIGAGIAGAAWLTGKALPTFVEGIKSFEALDGNRLVESAKGVGAIGVAMAAFGAGQGMQAIGGMMSGLAGFFGAETSTDELFAKLQSFGQDYNLDANRIERNAEAVVAYSKAMAAFGASDGVSGFGRVVGSMADGIMGMFGKERDQLPWDRMREFGEVNINADGIERNAGAVVGYAKAIGALSVISGVSALGQLASATADGIQGLFTGSAELPWDRMKKFGEVSINHDGIKSNSEAVGAFVSAMSELGGSGDGIGALARIGSAYSEMIAGFFSGSQDVPWAKMKKFGEDQGIKPDGVEKNARAVIAFTGAMQVMSDNANAGTRSGLDRVRALLAESIEVPWSDIRSFAQKQNINPGLIDENADIIASYISAMETIKQSVQGFNNGGLVSELQNFSSDNMNIQLIENRTRSLSELSGYLTDFSQTENTGLASRIGNAASEMYGAIKSLFQSQDEDISVPDNQNEIQAALEHYQTMIANNEQIIARLENSEDAGSRITQRTIQARRRAIRSYTQMIAELNTMSADEQTELKSASDNSELERTVTTQHEQNNQSVEHYQTMIANNEQIIARLENSEDANSRVTQRTIQARRRAIRAYTQMIAELNTMSADDQTELESASDNSELERTVTTQHEQNKQSVEHYQNLIKNAEKMIERESGKESPNQRIIQARERTIKTYRAMIDQIDTADLEVPQQAINGLEQTSQSVAGLSVIGKDNKGIEDLVSVLERLTGSLTTLGGMDISKIKDVLGMVKAERPEPPTPMRLDTPEQSTDNRPLPMKVPGSEPTQGDLRDILSQIASNSQRTNRLLTNLNDSIRTL